MAWFKRRKQGVVTPTTEKKETPEGLWFKHSVVYFGEKQVMKDRYL